jgi:excisionase family DNA binding protein
MWITTKEAAERLGISVRAIQKSIAKARYQARQVPGRGGNGLVWEVNVDISEPISEPTQSESTDTSSDTVKEGGQGRGALSPGPTGSPRLDLAVAHDPRGTG